MSALQIEIGPDHFAEVKHSSRKGEKVAEFSGSLLVLAVGNSRQAGRQDLPFSAHVRMSSHWGGPGRSLVSIGV